MTLNANMAEFLGFRSGGRAWGRLNYSCPLDSTAAGLGVDPGDVIDVFVEGWQPEKIARMRMIARTTLTGGTVELTWDLLQEQPT